MLLVVVVVDNVPSRSIRVYPSATDRCCWIAAAPATPSILADVMTLVFFPVAEVSVGAAPVLKR
jgi:hypothetical protein